MNASPAPFPLRWYFENLVVDGCHLGFSSEVLVLENHFDLDDERRAGVIENHLVDECRVGLNL